MKQTFQQNLILEKSLVDFSQTLNHISNNFQETGLV